RNAASRASIATMLGRLVDGAFVSYKPNFVATCLEAREHLLVTCSSDFISWGKDEAIRGYPIATVAAQLPL
ncbi:MAG: hypothetical protein RIF41_15565, partial [Polyangiaceae bacterium]